MFWYGVALLGLGFLTPSIALLALSDSVEVFMGANIETISSAATWGLFIGFALVVVGAAEILRGGGPRDGS